MHELNIARLEDRLLVVSRGVGVPAYDFDFDLNFACTHPYRFRNREMCVLRIGPVADYQRVYEEKANWGLRLVNTPQEHVRASDLEGWYPVIADLTPATRVFATLPSAEEIEAAFGWPVFVKGSRQTSRHAPSLSVARSAADYSALREAYRRDPILQWQRPAVREFVRLDPVAGAVPGKLPPSREFRTFWWNGTLVGCGPYWFQVPAYRATDLEAGLAIAEEAARRLSVPFLVVDIARKADGGWILVECNDAQEAGYAGLSPRVLWRTILDRL